MQRVPDAGRQLFGLVGHIDQGQVACCGDGINELPEPVLLSPVVKWEWEWGRC